MWTASAFSGLSSSGDFAHRQEAEHVRSHQLSHWSENAQPGMLRGAEHLPEVLIASARPRTCLALPSHAHCPKLRAHLCSHLCLCEQAKARAELEQPYESQALRSCTKPTAAAKEIQSSLVYFNPTTAVLRSRKKSV